MINQTQRQNTKECTHINETLIGNLEKTLGFCKKRLVKEIIKSNSSKLMINI